MLVSGLDSFSSWVGFSESKASLSLPLAHTLPINKHRPNSFLLAYLEYGLNVEGMALKPTVKAVINLQYPFMPVYS